MLIGTKLGAYEVIAKLGEGGMGEVYRAQDTRLGRIVALKVLPTATAADHESRLRLEREARAVANLNHPNICTLYDFGSDGDTDYLVMEHLDGETLAQRMTRGALPFERALKHAIEIAGALDAAHRAGIIHRDLKPSNVMLTASGAKLLDFGLAKLQQPEKVVAPGLETISAQALTLTGVIVGTLQYMSPEQVKGAAVDARSDIFSFGAVVYEMVTGRKAFQAEGQRNLIGAILDTEPSPISSIKPLASGEFERVIQKCLAKDPNERWQTMRDLMDALKWTATPMARPTPARALPKRGILVAVAAIAAAGVIAAWLWSRQAPTPPGLSGQRLITDYRGSHGWGSFSPDGKMIAYVSDADGSDQVWVKNLAAGDPIQLTFGSPTAARLAWSPAGDQIVFARAGAGIWSIPPLGGPPRRLIERGNRPKFSRDGRRLVFELTGEIWIANSDGTNVRRVYDPPPLSFASLPALSSDGESIVFFVSQGNGPLGDYWVLPVSGGPPRQLTFDHTTGGSAVWTLDNRSIIFPSTRGGSETLWQMPAEGGTPRPLTFGAGADVDPDISPDGRQLLYTNMRGATALVLTDLATNQQRELLERQSSIFGGAFSPAGDRVAFFYPVESGFHVFTVGTDGRELRQVTHGQGEINIFPHWSADGAFLYFFREKPSVAFMKMAVTGGTAVQVGPWSATTRARADPEGKRVVFERGDGETANATVVRDLGTGRETTLPAILRYARWLENGRAIVGTRETPNSGGPPRQEIMRCVIDGPCDALGDGFQPVPSGDGSRFFFLRPSTQGAAFREVWSINRDGSTRRQIGTLGPFRVGFINFDVSSRDQAAWSLVRGSENRIWLSEFR